MKSGKQVVLMRSMDGFGMPKEIIDNASVPRTDNPYPGNGDLPLSLIEIHYEDKVYQAPVQLFREKGVRYERPPYEAQYILPRKYFVTIDKKQLRMV